MKKVLSTLTTVTLLSTLTMAEEISTYLISSPASTSDVKSKLESNGFNVLATTNNIITITNPELQASNTYVATLQVYVGDSDVRVQNPAYFGTAYLEDAYKKGQFKSTIEALSKALGTLKGSKEKLDASEVSEYHFMMGMPYFSDFITIAKGKDLDKKIAKSSRIAYTLSLPNGTILVGHKLSPTTNGFLKTINQTSNAQILPYESLIQNNKVLIMNPKYYLALSFPQLSMGDFMKISSTPDDIENEIIKAYK